ncbi:MAG: flavodoxin family protein [Candidatus Omnitrophota bacterium]
MKKILVIAASPRRNGNSETLLDEAISALNGSRDGVKKIVLDDLTIAPCNGCHACFKTGRCVIKDDMQAFYKELLACETLVVASPIYFQGLPCQLKCVIDRCQALWSRKYILKKKLVNDKIAKKRRAGAILVAASTGAKNTFTGSIIVLKAWFKTMSIAYADEMLVEGLEAKDEARGKRGLREKAFKFGASLR